MTLPARRPRNVDVDPELGPVRYCARCNEWWPQDAEFFAIQVRPVGMTFTSRGRTYHRRTAVTTYHCRACRRERQARAGRYGS